MLTPGLSATLLASLLAQAEPAPPEPGPAPSGPAEAAPAEAGPAEQAPVEPAPTSSPSPAASTEPEAPPANAMAIHASFAYRPGGDATVAPREGFSLGATFNHRFILAAPVGVGVQVEFFHHQFSSDTTYVNLEPRRLVHDNFVVMPTLALELDPVRPWFAAGGGFTVAQGASTELLPVARVSAGADVRIAARSAIVVRVAYTSPIWTPTVAPNTTSPYGAFLDVGAGFLYRF